LIRLTAVYDPFVLSPFARVLLAAVLRGRVFVHYVGAVVLDAVRATIRGEIHRVLGFDDRIFDRPKLFARLIGRARIGFVFVDDFAGFIVGGLRSRTFPLIVKPPHLFPCGRNYLVANIIR
jgi:hypothetical protein